MISIRSRSLAAAAATALLLGPLASCGGDEDTPASADPTSTTSSTSTPTDGASETTDPENSAGASGDKVSVDDFVTRLSAAMDDQKSVHMSIDGEGAIELEADVQYGASPAIELHTTIGTSKVAMVILDRTLYIQQPGGKFTKIPKNDQTYSSLLGAFENLGPRGSIKELKAGITKVVEVGKETVDGEELTQYDVTADTTKIAGALQQLAGSGGTAKFVTMSFYLDAGDLIRQIGVRAAGQTVKMKFTDWGKPVDIKAPSGAQLSPSSRG